MTKFNKVQQDDACGTGKANVIPKPSTNQVMMVEPGQKTPAGAIVMPTEEQKKLFEAMQKEENRKKYAWESEAIKRCKEKLAHYLATGNAFKADVYQRKLDAHNSVAAKLRKLIG